MAYPLRQCFRDKYCSSLIVSGWSTRVLCAALVSGLVDREMRSSVNCAGRASISVMLQRQRPTARGDAYSVAMPR